MSGVMPWERLDGKVTTAHRQRLAIVYVRQSSKQQVLDHGESTRLQYALVDRAVALGWVASRVVVIDDDLGKSGASAVDRAGFQRLVTEITMGHVGLVLGIEMSRLARSGRDWYQLLELCSLSGALLADADGVYDPGEYNDRLLLGLKGTMSEAELYLIKQRMQAGRVNKARRGDLADRVAYRVLASPVRGGGPGPGRAGPDRGAADLREVRNFAELGSIQAVMRWLVEAGIEVGSRARTGPRKGEVVWRRPARATLTCMLNSPIYAGIYVYGRRRVDPASKLPGHPGSGLRRREPDQWLARIEGALPGLHQRRAVPGEPGASGHQPAPRRMFPARSGSARRCCRACCAAGAAGGG